MEDNVHEPSGAGASVARKPSKRQQEKAPEGQAPRMGDDADADADADGGSVTVNGSMNGHGAGPAPSESKFKEIVE